MSGREESSAELIICFSVYLKKFFYLYKYCKLHAKIKIWKLLLASPLSQGFYALSDVIS